MPHYCLGAARQRFRVAVSRFAVPLFPVWSIFLPAVIRFMRSKVNESSARDAISQTARRLFREHQQLIYKGIEIIRHMRTEKRLMRIPVMMITSESDFKLMKNSFDAGATVYLPKPFTTTQLLIMLRMLVSKNN